MQISPPPLKKSLSFTQQQLDIINQFGVGQAVIAGAGCGKTTTLVAKCLRLLELDPQARFCAVSFTEKSVQDLRKNLEQALRERNLPPHRHWIKTIHGLCSTILQEFPHDSGLAGGEKILLQHEAEQLWAHSVELLWTQDASQEVTEALDALLESYSTSQVEWLIKRFRYLTLVDPHSTQILPTALRTVFQSVEQRYLHSKQRRGVVDFSDLEVHALRALKNSSVAQYYQKRFNLVMVDEFQDTNPLQGEILEHFVRPQYSNLCIVGDPKQSIYRFRDADVSVFYELSKKMPKQHFLSVNYRSKASILHWVNQVCEPLFAVSELPYDPLHDPLEVDEKAGEDSNGAFLAAHDPDVLQLKAKTAHELALFLKQKMLEGENIGEYAILSRSLQSKLRTLLLALKHVGVPYALGSGGRFYEDPKVQEIVCFLKSFTGPQQRYSQWVVLRSPWVNAKEKNYEDFFKNTEHPYAGAFSGAFQTLISQKNQIRPAQALEVLMDLLPETSEMSMPLLKLWHLCEELSASGLRYDEVVEELEDYIEKKAMEKEVPPPLLQGVIPVLSIHASKGLEFKKVILVDFGSAYRAQGGFQDLFWNRKDGAFLVHRDENGERITKDPENEKWKEIEAKAAVSESKRLFYVAITRAKEQLILWWPERVSDVEEPQLMKDDWRSWVAQSHFLELNFFSSELAQDPITQQNINSERKNPLPPQSFEFAPSAQNTELTEIKPFRPRHSPSEWRILEQCPLRYAQKWLAQKEPDLLEESKDHNGTPELDLPELHPSHELGEELHLLLQNEDWVGVSDFLIKNSKRSSSSIQNELAELKKTLQEDSQQVFRELAFETKIEESVTLVGKVDRMVVQPASQGSQGECVKVYDYKWTLKPKSSHELLKDYEVQLKAYALAASKLTQAQSVETYLVHFSPQKIQTIAGPVYQSTPNTNSFEELKVWAMAHAHHANELMSTLLKLPQSTFNVTQTVVPAQVGDHCRYCEWKNNCNAANLRNA